MPNARDEAEHLKKHEWKRYIARFLFAHKAETCGLGLIIVAQIYIYTLAEGIMILVYLK